MSVLPVAGLGWSLASQLAKAVEKPMLGAGERVGRLVAYRRVVVAGNWLAVAHMAARCAAQAGGFGYGVLALQEHRIVDSVVGISRAVILVGNEHNRQVALGPYKADVLRVDIVGVISWDYLG
jgi:uncharacterized membrane protein YccF (DUF307 family)